MKIRRSVKKGETIFNQGSFSDCAYIIESGSVEILDQTPEGKPKILGVLEENDIFGEMGLIDGLPRSATARAKEDSQISVLSKEVFDSLSKHNPEALIPILKVLTSRLRETLSALKEGRKMPKPNQEKNK